MNGIEILSSKEVASMFSFNWTSFGVLAGVLFAVFIVIGLIFSVKDKDWAYLTLSSIVGIILAAMFGGLFGTITSTPTEYETQYKITISDEVSMNKFAEKYEILDQEGKIYTVREKE